MSDEECDAFAKAAGDQTLKIESAKAAARAKAQDDHKPEWVRRKDNNARKFAKAFSTKPPQSRSLATHDQALEQIASTPVTGETLANALRTGLMLGGNLPTPNRLVAIANGVTEFLRNDLADLIESDPLLYAATATVRLRRLRDYLHGGKVPKGVVFPLSTSIWPLDGKILGVIASRRGQVEGRVFDRDASAVKACLAEIDPTRLKQESRPSVSMDWNAP